MLSPRSSVNVLMLISASSSDVSFKSAIVVARLASEPPPPKGWSVAINTLTSPPPGQMPAQNNISMIDSLPNMQQNGGQQNNGLSNFQSQAIENSFMESMEPMKSKNGMNEINETLSLIHI